MSSRSRELVFLILQFLNEEKFQETVHKLEQESGFFFDMNYFEDEVNNGNWDQVERYISGFTKVDDNCYSMRMFFEIRKQKYLESLDNSYKMQRLELENRHDRSKALDILMKDLQVFALLNEELLKEIAELLTLDNFRENEHFSKYGDTKSARTVMLAELKKLMEFNPLFRDRLLFPNFRSSRLRTLINQSLNWQHQLCESPSPNPCIKTLFSDHLCGQTNGACASSDASNSPVGSLPIVGGFLPLDAHVPFQPTPVPVPMSSAGWIPNLPTVNQTSISGTMGLGAPSVQAALKHPRTLSTNGSLDYPYADSDLIIKRSRSMGISDEAVNALDDLPLTVARTLNQGSTPMSMDFHPIQQTLLLVGTNVGDIGLWEVGSKERLVLKNFKVWDLCACPVALQAALVEDTTIFVNRVMWSPDGSLFGVAYSRQIVQLYAYYGGADVREHLEIDAHVGGVNDLAFSHPNKQLCLITCGDDKTIKVWDAATGTKKFTFEGHNASVYSICPHYMENVQFVLSTAQDGKIKVWLYNNLGSSVDYDAPGHWCTTMAYSDDGIRLFSCGTGKDGESHVVEWNESEGAVKRTYQGFWKRSFGVVQFDTTKNRFLAVGDDYTIKFWDMDSVQLLTSVDADGGLPASPRIRFNKGGTLLAVSTNEKGMKILADSDGLQLLRTFEILSYDASKASESLLKPTLKQIPVAAAAASSTGFADMIASVVPGSKGEARNLSEVKLKKTEDINYRSTSLKLTEIDKPSQCQSLKLPKSMRMTKVSRLTYTNSGDGILALSSNAIHVLWRWNGSDSNSSGKAMANVSPQLWQPSSGILMTNDVTGTNAKEDVACFALSENDSFVMSASGGKISLFNMVTFKMMKTFMPPPPAATFFAFYPQDNNIIAIGMDDSTIQIYNIRASEVKCKLMGHLGRITGLAFSHMLNVLVSSGADAQICVWNSNGWKRQKARFLHLPSGKMPRMQSDTFVQFHQDQIHFLVVHETQLALYEAIELECVRQWFCREYASPISHATLSCDSELVYACFLDATVGIFTTANLHLYCRINHSAYLSPNASNLNVHPVVVAAHPHEQNQFALGLSDGEIYIFEPASIRR